MNSLTWIKTSDAYYLGSPTEELVKLQYETTSKTSFWINNEAYQVKRSGFWNQRYVIYINNIELVTVAHNFWGSNGKIKFSDGTQYASDYNHKNTLTLRFMEGDSEILSYHVGMENGKRQAVLNLGIALVDAEKLLLLTTLGMVMFLNIFNEFNDEGDDDSFLLVSAAS